MLNPIEISTSPVKDDHDQIVGMVTVFRDITERKQAEITLEKNEQPLSNIFDLINKGLFVLGPNSNYTHWNRAMENFPIFHVMRSFKIQKLPGTDSLT